MVHFNFQTGAAALVFQKFEDTVVIGFLFFPIHKNNMQLGTKAPGYIYPFVKSHGSGAGMIESNKDFCNFFFHRRLFR